MRTVYRILLRLSIVLGIVTLASLAVSVIANRDAVFGTGRYAAFDPSTAVSADDLPVPPPGYELDPVAIKEEKDGSLTRTPIPIDRTKSSWHDATLAGCKAAGGSDVEWCDRGDPVPDLTTFEYCTKSGAPAWCRGVEKIGPDRRVPTADVPKIVWDPPGGDFRAARREALFSAFFVPGLIGSAALAVLALAWILKPETAHTTVP